MNIERRVLIYRIMEGMKNNEEYSAVIGLKISHDFQNSMHSKNVDEIYGKIGEGGKVGEKKWKNA